ncbi:restriction endonuclease subunit S [Thermaurantiacus tibetensis]|uniref:restriction endonuclease subunit S n=1 Tax=Thermaurantiacus tibetensis TaxID=2759035 RepID=UPI00188EA462|nr:restriction endonuclease subunit S [Thermaurantiacus tibetensis]
MTRWPLHRLGELCDIIGGGTPSRERPEYFGGDIPWITPTDVTKGCARYLDRGAEAISELGLKNSSAKLIPPRSVLLTTRATIGFTAINTVPVTTNQGFANLVCGPHIWPEYLAYWLEWSRDRLVELASGATFKEINKSTLKRLPIPLPPLEEQRRIVAILDRAASLRRRIEAARARARALIPALFLETFGDPATNPKGWPDVTLGAVLGAPLSYGSMIRPNANETGWLDIRVANIKAGRIDCTDRKFVELAPENLDRHALQDGDIVLARAIGSEAHLGKCAVVYPGNERWAYDSHVMRIRLDPDRISPLWLHALMNTEGGKRRLLQRSRASAIQHNINTKEVAAFTFGLPPLPLQKAFAEQVARIEALARRLDAAESSAGQLAASLSAQVFGD